MSAVSCGTHFWRLTLWKRFWMAASPETSTLRSFGKDCRRSGTQSAPVSVSCCPQRVPKYESTRIRDLYSLIALARSARLSSIQTFPYYPCLRPDNSLIDISHFQDTPFNRGLEPQNWAEGTDSEIDRMCRSRCRNGISMASFRNASKIAKYRSLFSRARVWTC